MKNHKGRIRGFCWCKKAYYAKALLKELPKVCFGMFCKDGGGTSGEMSMVWENICNKATPQLKCFCDGWSALSLFADLIKKLGEHDSEDITEEQFVEILRQCGFKDLTPYEDPNRNTEESNNYRRSLEKELLTLEKRCKEIKDKLST